jgi:hypothetical protein
MNCTERSAGPAARTSPPRAKRCGQYVNLPVGSCGPTMKARTHDEGAVAEHLPHCALAQHLERAVVGVVRQQLVRGLVAELGLVVALPDGPAKLAYAEMLETKQ